MSNIYDDPIKMYVGIAAADNFPQELQGSGFKNPLILVEKKSYSKRKILGLFTLSTIVPCAIVEIDLQDKNSFKDQNLVEIVQAFSADSILCCGSSVLYSIALESLNNNESSLTSNVGFFWLPQKSLNFDNAMKFIKIAKEKKSKIGLSKIDSKTVFIDDHFISLSAQEKRIALQLTYDLINPLLNNSDLSPISRALAEVALTTVAESFYAKKKETKILILQSFFLAYSAIVSSPQDITFANNFEKSTPLGELKKMIENRCLIFMNWKKI